MLRYNMLLYDLCVWTGTPDPPSYVSLTVASSSSLLVKFDEPLNHNGAVVTRYKGKGNFNINWELNCCDYNNWKDYFIKRQKVFKINSEVLSSRQRHLSLSNVFFFFFFFWTYKNELSFFLLK